MAEFFEYDPITGIRTDTSYDEMTGEMTLHRSADVQPLYDIAAKVRNEYGVNSKGIKESWWHYATIQPIDVLRMRAKGINVFDKNDHKRMFEEINTNLPHAKMTTGNHGGKVKLYNRV